MTSWALDFNPGDSFTDHELLSKIIDDKVSHIVGSGNDAVVLLVVTLTDDAVSHIVRSGDDTAV